MTELYPGVFRVPVVGSSAFLIEDDGLTLIDCGGRGSGPLIVRYLRRIGHDSAEITRIVLTHTHPDHSGGLDELRTITPAPVFVHEAEASFLSGVDPFPNPFQQPWMARAADRVMTMLHPAPVAEPLALRHNDVLPVFGGLRVIHAPGHTPGSICLLVEQNRLLFAGDVMEYRRGALCEPSPRFTHDPSEARRSIELLAGLAVETILLSHFRPVHRARAKLRRLIDGWGD